MIRPLLLGALALLLAVLRSHAETPRPNILFAIADDWSYGHAGAYGCAWVRTPAFDRVAREGLLFSRAYTPNAKCGPSRSCILTGRNPWQLKDACNHWAFFPPEFHTYPEALAAHGYTVGMTGKGWAPGVALDGAGHPRFLAGTPYHKRTAPPPTTGIGRNDYAGNFADFLEAAPAGQPWCFWYGGLEPHRDYEYGSGVVKGGKKPGEIDHLPPFWPDNETVRNDLLDYAFEVEHFDRHLGRMLDLLAERGLLENTLVIVTSDNGMPFPRIKGQEYDASNHLPLAVRWPAGIQQPGRRVEEYVSFIDFAPTFLEVAQVAWNESGLAPSPGRSLTDLFRGDAPAPPRDHVLIGKERHDVGRPHDEGYPIRGICRDGYLYLHNFETARWPAGNPETGYLNCDGGPTKTEVLKIRTDPAQLRRWEECFGPRTADELYHVTDDPDCVHNLAGQPELQALQEKLRSQLFSELAAQEDPRMFGRGSVFEEYPYADPTGRGFYERWQAGEKMKAAWVSPTDFEPPVTQFPKE